MKKRAGTASQNALVFLALCLSVVTAVGLGGKNPAESHLWLSAIALVLAVGAITLAVRIASPGLRFVTAVQSLALSIASFVVAAIIHPVIQGARPVLPSSLCISNVKRLSLALIMYAADSDSRMPPATAWRTLSKPYGAEDEFRCPESKAPWTYAMNDAMSGINTDDLDRFDTVLLFEAEAQVPNAAGGSELFRPRHPQGGCVGMVDGTTKMVDGDGAKGLPWSPHFTAKPK